MHFNILNRLGVDHECDCHGRTDGRTDRWPLEIARSNIITFALKTAQVI